MSTSAKDTPAVEAERDDRAGAQERAADPARLVRALSVRDVLGTAVLAGSRVLAGEQGLDRPAQRLNVLEAPDSLEWVKPHELVLTTGYLLQAGLHRGGDLARLAAELDRHQVSALAVKFGRHLDALPDTMLREADRRGFPLIALPEHVAFDDVLEQVLTELLNRQSSALARAEETHRALVQIVLGGGGLPDVAAGLVTLLGGVVVIATQDGRVLADGGDS